MINKFCSFKKYFFPQKAVNLCLFKVELIAEINFETFGQILYNDANGHPCIEEFQGNRWSKKIFITDINKIKFRLFVYNQYLKQGRYLFLIKKIDDVIVDQLEFQVNENKLYDGWFELN